ncbi:hypothetical protein CKA32_002475 [Geitlerinema sp. FC II]|nr:hypothetical protein CKA32_002475 [Geitlerinema sp. FC II]
MQTAYFGSFYNFSIQILRSTPAIAESLAGGVAKRDRGE